MSISYVIRDLLGLHGEELLPYIMFFVLGSVGTMAAFGAGFGAFITTKTLTRLANKIYKKIREDERNDKMDQKLLDNSSIPPTTPTPYQQEYEIQQTVRQAIEAERANVSQYSPAGPEITARSEIQPRSQGQYLGGDKDCYKYCKYYEDNLRCNSKCPMAISTPA